MENEKLINLIKRVYNGDMTAFAEIYKEFYNEIYYYALKF